MSHSGEELNEREAAIRAFQAFVEAHTAALSGDALRRVAYGAYAFHGHVPYFPIPVTRMEFTIVKADDGTDDPLHAMRYLAEGGAVLLEVECDPRADSPFAGYHDGGDTGAIPVTLAALGLALGELDQPDLLTPIPTES